MQRREFNRATFEVASSTDISGRATADEINRGLRTRKEKSFWRVASLTFLGSFTVAGLLVAVAPLPARADDDKDSRHGHEDNDKGIRAEIAALQAQMAALQHEVNTLQTANADQQKEINSLQTSNTTLQKQVGDVQKSNAALQKQLAVVRSNHALLLGPFVNVDPNPEIGVIGPNIIFSGANIHIVSGSGRTDDNLNNGGSLTGLGNLIIGYDDDPAPAAPASPLKEGDRGGSHNLVIGRYNRFTRAVFGGLVAGQFNAISNEGGSVSGGEFNTASGAWASISGGLTNTASGQSASVSGGGGNTASGFGASVSGGAGNTASGDGGSVSGGGNNTASGSSASVSGGAANTASGAVCTVLGGQNNTANGVFCAVLGGLNNATGTVLSATGTPDSVVLGGVGVTANRGESIAPQPPFP